MSSAMGRLYAVRSEPLVPLFKGNGWRPTSCPERSLAPDAACCDARQEVELVVKEAPAEVSCTECGRRRLDGERWRLWFADLGEVAVYCPECDEREFGAEG